MDEKEIEEMQALVDAVLLNIFAAAAVPAIVKASDYDGSVGDGRTVASESFNLATRMLEESKARGYADVYTHAKRMGLVQ